MTDEPKRIWARRETDWHDGETGEDFTGGTWDAGYHKDGKEYVRADRIAALQAERDELEEIVLLEREESQKWHETANSEKFYRQTVEAERDKLREALREAAADYEALFMQALRKSWIHGEEDL